MKHQWMGLLLLAGMLAAGCGQEETAQAVQPETGMEAGTVVDVKEKNDEEPEELPEEDPISDEGIDSASVTLYWSVGKLTAEQEAALVAQEYEESKKNADETKDADETSDSSSEETGEDKEDSDSSEDTEDSGESEDAESKEKEETIPTKKTDKYFAMKDYQPYKKVNNYGFQSAQEYIVLPVSGTDVNGNQAIVGYWCRFRDCNRDNDKYKNVKSILPETETTADEKTDHEDDSKSVSEDEKSDESDK